MNIYEQLVFDELESQKLAVFTPYKDRGVDCIVVPRDFVGRPQKIQIKGSRTYLIDVGGWYRINKRKLDVAKTATDFWVFVSIRVGDKGRFQPVFLVVPTVELYKRLISYAKVSRGEYNLNLSWNDPYHTDMVVDTRAGCDGWGPTDPWPIPPRSPRDYTSYNNNWGLLLDALKA